MRRPGFQPWAIGFAVVFLPIFVVGVRSIQTAHAELAAGRIDQSEGRSVRAIEHYRRAMRWTFPFSPYPDRAADALRELAVALEDQQDTQGALLAWRSIAGSSAATRSFWAGESPLRREAVEAIARLSGPSSEDPYLARLAGSSKGFSTSVSARWGTALVLGFAVWVGGLWLTASRGFDASGTLRWVRARRSLAIALTGFALFIVGMLFA